jgi:hypothetical protein
MERLRFLFVIPLFPKETQSRTASIQARHFAGILDQYFLRGGVLSGRPSHKKTALRHKTREPFGG